MSPGSGSSCHMLVVASPHTPELEVLKQLPDGVTYTVGQQVSDLTHLTSSEWEAISVVLVCGVGENAGKKENLQAMWPKLSGLRWIHSCSAGLEKLLFPELVDGDVTLTNARGVYSHSLAEYALSGCKMLAIDLPRLSADKAARRWSPFLVEELRNKTLGIVGYGDIGAACARIARAYKMRVKALRRRTELSADEQKEGLLDGLYAPDRLHELLGECDYVILATPHTPDTHHLIDAAAIAAMKPSAVFVNIGRGKCVDEPALVEALTHKKIRGAVLDVFETEPLPESSPLWGLDNVILSPHCADATKEFQFESMQLFVRNMQRYLAGEQLLNVCDKHKGY